MRLRPPVVYLMWYLSRRAKSDFNYRSSHGTEEDLSLLLAQKFRSGFSATPLAWQHKESVLASNTDAPHTRPVSISKCLFLFPLVYAALSMAHVPELIARSSNVVPGLESNPKAFVVSFGLAVTITMVVAFTRKNHPSVGTDRSLLLAVAIMVVGECSMFATAALDSAAAWAVALGGLGNGLVASLLAIKWAHIYRTLMSRERLTALALSICAALVLNTILSAFNPGILSIFFPGLALLISTVAAECIYPQGTDTDASTIADRTGEARCLLCALWPVLAVSLLGSMIAGLSMGNALGGNADYIAQENGILRLATRVAGVAICAFVLGKSQKPCRVYEPLALGIAGLWLASWLITLVVPSAIPFSTEIPTGIANGMMFVLVCYAACSVENRAGTALCCCIIGITTAVPLLMGIVAGPFIGPQASALLAPLCCIVFLGASRFVVRNNESLSPTHDTTPTVDDIAHDLSLEAGLTQRESEVLGYLAHGHSSNYISEQMSLSVHTVKTHVRHIYAKLDVHTRDEFLAIIAKREK